MRKRKVLLSTEVKTEKMLTGYIQRSAYLFAFFILTVISINLSSCKSDKKAGKKEAASYTCPMHPQIIQHAPGICPICKMDLVKVEVKRNEEAIKLSENQIKLANIQVQQLSSNNFQTSKILNGTVLTNPELSELISSRYAGRIEKLFVKEVGIQVLKGQILYQIYSEELQSLQQDFILQVKQSNAFPGEGIYQNLKLAAKNKLKLYGYTNAQIAALEKSRVPSARVNVYAPVSGIVKELNITEGAYVSEGSPVMQLENFSKLWIEADVYPAEVSLIKVGGRASVSVEGMPAIDARIDFVSPALDPSSQILKARLNIQNPGYFQAGMHATVSITSANISNVIALPIDAVIRDEKESFVWIKTGKGTFERRAVETGKEDESQIIIISGLEGAAEAVVSGAYLLNSELELKRGD